MAEFTKIKRHPINLFDLPQMEINVFESVIEVITYRLLPLIDRMDPYIREMLESRFEKESVHSEVSKPFSVAEDVCSAMFNDFLEYFDGSGKKQFSYDTLEFRFLRRFANDLRIHLDKNGFYKCEDDLDTWLALNRCLINIHGKWLSDKIPNKIEEKKSDWHKFMKMSRRSRETFFTLFYEDMILNGRTF